MSLLSDSPENVQQLEDQQDAVIAELDALNDQIMAILDEFSPKAEPKEAIEESSDCTPSSEVEPLRPAA